MNTQQQIRMTDRSIPSTASPLFIIGIIVIAANLRAPLTSVGPLTATIRDSLGLTSGWAGMITTLPLLAFALLSPFASRLARIFGMEKVIFTSLSVLALGILVRSGSGTFLLFTGTMLLGLAIAICNVLMPALIKREFPEKVGILTGVYSVAMNLCGAIASGVSIPLAQSIGLGWQGSLVIWVVLAALGISIWIPQLRVRIRSHATSKTSDAKTNLWRSPLAWQVTLFMGLQSFIFYVTVPWLPEILSSRGLNSGFAGWMLSLMQFSQLPCTFVVPILAGRMKNQRILVVLMAVFFAVSITGFMFGGNAWIPLCAILLGIAGGFAFSLAMMFFTLRTKTSLEAAELSGMAQSVGYLLASVGPPLFGLLHDITGSWSYPMTLLLVASLLLFIFGMSAAKNRLV